jgi:hypothetical protein
VRWPSAAHAESRYLRDGSGAFSLVTFFGQAKKVTNKLAEGNLCSCYVVKKIVSKAYHLFHLINACY